MESVWWWVYIQELNRTGSPNFATNFEIKEHEFNSLMDNNIVYYDLYLFIKICVYVWYV